MALPGLARDVVVISRPGSTVDAEGNYIGILPAGTTVTGTYGTPSTTEQLNASQRGDQVDAVVALANTVDIKISDVVDLRNKRWVVVDVRDVRLHQRVFLRQDVS